MRSSCRVLACLASRLGASTASQTASGPACLALLGSQHLALAAAASQQALSAQLMIRPTQGLRSFASEGPEDEAW